MHPHVLHYHGLSMTLMKTSGSWIWGHSRASMKMVSGELARFRLGACMVEVQCRECRVWDLGLGKIRVEWFGVWAVGVSAISWPSLGCARHANCVPSHPMIRHPLSPNTEHPSRPTFKQSTPNCRNNVGSGLQKPAAGRASLLACNGAS